MAEEKLPLYLGYNKEERSFYFYGVKDKLGRFLKYGSYFYWAKECPAVLDPSVKVPEDINLELNKFLQGKVGYEFVKSRRNSKTSNVVKTYFTEPPEISCKEPPAATQIFGRPEVRKNSKHRPTGSGVEGSSPVVSGLTSSNEGNKDTKPRRSPRKPKTDLDGKNRCELKEIQIATPKEPKPKKPRVAIPKTSEATPKVDAKEKSKKASKNDNQLGPLVVIEPPKKRHRRTKAEMELFRAQLKGL